MVEELLSVLSRAFRGAFLMCFATNFSTRAVHLRIHSLERVACSGAKLSSVPQRALLGKRRKGPVACLHESEGD